MMENSEFRNQAHFFVDWMSDYLEDPTKYPVKSQVMPGDIFKLLPSYPPEIGESMDCIFSDFNRIILPGITHWQSPNFHAYFPANSSYPSILAEMLIATLGAQCMKWETSPAAAELEELTMNWLKKMTGIPNEFHGVIQDSASSATLVAILTAREKASSFEINEKGFVNQNFRVYCSSEAHSSVEKAVRIAGLGRNNLIKVPVDEYYRMIPDELSKAIRKDIRDGKKPLCIVSAMGTTGSTAIDPLPEIAEICNNYGIWLHVDAAYAGSALLLPEFRWMINGIEMTDSFVFNPHKWLFTNFDCSAYYVKDKAALLNTFSILPEYLRTANQGKVNDYCDWGIPLGRRFRALKLWFVIRNYGVQGLQEKLRHHIHLASEFRKWLDNDGRFEILAPVTLNLICFRYNPGGLEEDEINHQNEMLLKKINETGKAYLTHTKLNGKYSIRMVIGQTNVEKHHVENTWKIITDCIDS